MDASIGDGLAYYMVNGAHPDHFSAMPADKPWAPRIRGLRCNASRMSHAELDSCATLDDGDPDELAAQYRDMRDRLTWLNVFGGRCGSALRHVTRIAQAIAA